MCACVRVCVCPSQTIALLTSTGAFNTLDGALWNAIHAAVLGEVSETTDFVKVVSSVPVFIAFLSVASLRGAVVDSVLLLLTHPWPRIRSMTSQRFFEFVIANESFVDDTKFEGLTEVLSVTPWDGERDDINEGVQRLCSLLDAELPTKTLNSTVVEREAQDTEFGYDALVNEVGY